MVDRYDVVLTDQQIFDNFVLDGLKNISDYGDYLFTRYKQLYDTENIDNIVNNIQKTFQIFNISKEEALSIVKRNFEINKEDTESINLQSFCKFYEKKYTFHALIMEFIQSVYGYITNIFIELEEKIRHEYIEIDKLGKGFLELNEFEQFMKKLIPSRANDIYFFSDLFK